MKYLKVWTSFRDVIKNLNDEEKGRLFTAMLVYAETGEEPENLHGNDFVIWPAAKQSIDLTAERNAKLRENASKGGLAKAENQKLANDSKSYQSVANDSKDEQKLAEKKRNEMKRNEKEGNENVVILKPKKQFTPPTVEDVKAYCEERGSWLIDPVHFVNYYETRGWMLKKNQPMVDWKAAVRLWESNERKRQKEEKAADYDLPM